MTNVKTIKFIFYNKYNKFYFSSSLYIMYTRTLLILMCLINIVKIKYQPYDCDYFQKE